MLKKKACKNTHRKIQKANNHAEGRINFMGKKRKGKHVDVKTRK